jgi:hypothetical protein
VNGSFITAQCVITDAAIILAAVSHGLYLMLAATVQIKAGHMSETGMT